MNYLFEPVRFDASPLEWGYRSRSETDFPGFYHWHQCCEMLFVHEGQGTIIVNQTTHEIRRGMLFFFQPFQLHKVYANVSPLHPYVRSVIHFDPVFLTDVLRAFPSCQSFFTQLWKGSNVRLAFDVLRKAGHFETILEMYAEAAAAAGGGSDENHKLLFLQLVHSLMAFGRVGDRGAPETFQARTSHYSETIMQWIEDHYTGEVNLDNMAEELHLSRYYVSRIFSRETGSSITDYLTARRVKQACRLLQTTAHPVERIGIAVGIPNVSYFIRLFKKAVGTTPLKYRNQCKI